MGEEKTAIRPKKKYMLTDWEYETVITALQRSSGKARAKSKDPNERMSIRSQAEVESREMDDAAKSLREQNGDTA